MTRIIVVAFFLSAGIGAVCCPRSGEAHDGDRIHRGVDPQRGGGVQRETLRLTGKLLIHFSFVCVRLFRSKGPFQEATGNGNNPKKLSLFATFGFLEMWGRVLKQLP